MRPLPVTRAVRIARGLALGAITTSLAAAAHALSGAALPSPGVLTVVACLAIVAGTASTRSRMAPVRVVVIVVVGQLLVHELLMLLVAVDAADPLRQQPMHGMPGMAVPVVAGGSDPVWSMLARHAAASVTTLPGATMLGCHALLVGLWLAAGESVLWCLLEILASGRRSAAFQALVRALGAAERGTELLHDRRRARESLRLAPPWRPSTWFLVRSAVRRGPPSGVLALI